MRPKANRSNNNKGQTPTRNAEQEPPLGADTAQDVHALLGSLLNVSSDAVIVIDELQRIQVFNKGAEAIFGHSAEEAVGQPLELLIPPRLRQAHRKYVKLFARSPEASRAKNSRAELVGLRKDGTEFPAEASISKYGAAGSMRLMVILRDIAKRKQAEKSLEESKAHLANIAENLPGIVFRRIQRQDGSVTFSYFSPKVEDFFGIAPEAAMTDPQSIIDAIHPEDLPSWRRAVERSARELTPFNFENRIVRPDGSIRWMRTTAHPRQTGNGEVVWDGISLDVTEQKRAEEARHESEHLLAIAIESMADGLALYDANDRLVLCNDRYRGVYPKHADQIILGRRFEDMLRAGVYAGEFAEAIGREEEWIANRMLMHVNPEGPIEQKLSDGRWLRVEEWRTKWGGIVGLRTDITELKQAEQRAAEANSRLMDAIESVSEAFVLYDSEDRLVLCNDKFREIYTWPAGICVPGVKFEQLARAGAEAGMYPDANGRLEEWLQERLAQHRDVTGTYVRHLADGRWLQVRNRRTREGGIVGVRTDITERKLAEEAVSESEARFRAVIDASPTAILLKDREGRFRMVNKCFAEWYGVTQSDAFGKTSHDLYPNEIADTLIAQDQQVLDNLRLLELEYDVPFVDGTIHKVVVAKFPVFSSAGEPIGVGSISTDVTGQRQIEEQLRQVQKMDAIGKLTGGVAHDFNNLLTVIFGNLEFLENHLTDKPDAQQYIDTVLMAAQRGADLTQRLLAFSRKQTLRPEVVDVNELLAKTLDLMRRTLGEHIELEVLAGGEQLHAIVDEGQLENALLNLAVNARDAMPEGGKLTFETADMPSDEVDIDVEAEMAPGRYVTVAVTDTGAGMSPEVLRRVFEPFFTTKEVGKGTGLGLAMVYGFIKQSGGDIKVQSEVGRGTTMTMYLPMAEGAAAGARPSAESTPRRPTGSETILVVEDDPDVRFLVVSALESLGYRVLEAESGPAVVTLLDQAPRIDLLLTDVVLPGGMNGRQIANEVRTRYPDIKVLFTSGYTQDVIVHQGRLDEDAELLVKPYTMKTFAQKIREILDCGEQRSART